MLLWFPVREMFGKKITNDTYVVEEIKTGISTTLVESPAMPSFQFKFVCVPCCSLFANISALLVEFWLIENPQKLFNGTAVSEVKTHDPVPTLLLNMALVFCPPGAPIPNVLAFRSVLPPKNIFPVKESEFVFTTAYILCGATPHPANDVVIFEVEDNSNPSEPQVGPFTSVPLYVPRPPSEYAVEPVPAFCVDRSGQHTMLL